MFSLPELAWMRRGKRREAPAAKRFMQKCLRWQNHDLKRHGQRIRGGRVGFSTNAGTREGLIGIIPKISGRYENGNGL